MEGLAKWLADISWPIVSRVLASLGLGTVTFVGADSALTSAINAAKTTLSGLGSDVIQLIALAGFFDFMAITAGGMVSGLAWLVMKRFALHQVGP